jgi:hypothetical protein
MCCLKAVSALATELRDFAIPAGIEPATSPLTAVTLKRRPAPVISFVGHEIEAARFIEITQRHRPEAAESADIVAGSQHKLYLS